LNNLKINMSPRPKKIRLCQGNFCGKSFKPTGIPLSRLDRIELYRDELEALRLCDRDELTQEEAGKFMGVSRGTVQRIIAVARLKVATALSEGKALIFVDTEKGDTEPPPSTSQASPS
jgi:predicted DNA-binding protein (UPF0251 family)